MKVSAFFASAILAAFISSAALATTYTIDPMHSSVGFSVTHMMISKVSGHFGKHDSTFDFDTKTGELKNVNSKIDLDTIDTGVANRDGHLKTPDFFGVRTKDGNKLVAEKQFMTFKQKGAAKINVASKAPVKIEGDLTLNGVTKPVTLMATYRGSMPDMMDKTVVKVGFEATGKINRKDFGLTWNKSLDAGGVAVGDDVTITLDGEGVPPKATK